MLATIERIENVTVHPNADRLEIVHVRGYQCIVPKGGWHTDDTCVLIQPDSVLPDTAWAQPYKQSNRVKAIRLRGEWSFGIVEKPYNVGVVNGHIGDEVSTQLGITKYEAPEPQQLDAKRATLPFGMPKTDETRWQNLRNVPYGEQVVVTLKVDGQSATYYYYNGEFGVTGRTLEYKPKMPNRYTDHINRYDLASKLTEYCQTHGVNLALRGESYGRGIQNFAHNPHAQCNPALAFYSVWLIDEMRYATPFEKHSVRNVCATLGLPTVPVIESGILTHEMIIKYTQLKKLQGNYFEGVVIAGGGFSFKVINMEYDSKK